MRAVIFRTPGLIPVEAFTTHGINVKPKTETPIGYFGTGLKYVVAVLARHGIKLRVFIGTTEYEFYPKTMNFRGKDFEWLMMKKRKSLTGKWGAQQLSYTTEYGKNWELWQVLRELQSNTIDENGTSEVSYDDRSWMPRIDESHIIVESDEFARIYEEQLDKIFLPIDQLTLRDASDTLKIYNQPSQHIYYRGLRVYDLETPTMYTYNILQRLDLTEDRTIKYMFEAKAILARHMSRTKDEKLIHSVVGSTEKFFEHKFDYDFVYESPSEEFMKAIRTRRLRNLPVSSFAGAYYSKYSPPERVPVAKMSLVEQWQWWLDSGKINDEELRKLVVRTIDELNGRIDGPVTVAVVAPNDTEIPF